MIQPGALRQMWTLGPPRVATLEVLCESNLGVACLQGSFHVNVKVKTLFSQGSSEDTQVRGGGLFLH